VVLELVYCFQVYTSVRECDEEIAEYACSRQCFAILGQDTDYVIYEGAHYYLSMSKLNLSSMTTLNYNRWALARHLAVRPNQLPLLASLIGNDIVPTSDLKVQFNLYETEVFVVKIWIVVFCLSAFWGNVSF
jgi:hypothetical protein